LRISTRYIAGFWVLVFVWVTTAVPVPIV
jgi:hypothetical protein